MSDNITLPREVVEGALEALDSEHPDIQLRAAIARRAALAAEQPKHPGYVIGNHWFETAYERLCAGEAEDAILEDYEVVREPRLRDLRRDAERYKWVLGWLVRTGLLSCKACRIDKPESYGNWWILRKPWSIDDGSFVAYAADLKDAIDAAMKEDKT